MNLNEVCLLNFLKDPKGLNGLSILLETLQDKQIKTDELNIISSEITA